MLVPDTLTSIPPDGTPSPRISVDDFAARDVNRSKELIDCGGGWVALACPWCRHETDDFRDVSDVYDGEEYAILACPECSREYVVEQSESGIYYACAVMSAADLRYLRWREAHGLPGSYGELTP